MVEAQEKLEFAQGKSPCVFLRPTRPELEWIDHIKSVHHCSPETEPPTSTRAVSCPVGLSLQPKDRAAKFDMAPFPVQRGPITTMNFSPPPTTAVLSLYTGR